MFSIFSYLGSPFPPLASLVSKVQRKPGGGGKAEEAGPGAGCAQRQAAVSGAARRSAGISWRTRAARARLPLCARLGAHRLAQVACYRSPWRAEGSRGTLCQPAPASSRPSDLSDLGSRPRQGVCSLGQEEGAGAPTGLRTPARASNLGAQVVPGAYWVPGPGALADSPLSLA